MTAARPHPFSCHRLLAALATALPLALLGAAPGAGAAVVISQVYGGGGNSGATYTHDFVELHNTGSSAVSLSGWTLQYGAGSATGTFSATANVQALSGSIAPGGYFLVQMAKGTGGTQALPTPDLVGSIAMGGGAGKVLLLSSGSPLAAACATPGGSVADLVAYGTANTCFEGSAAAPGTGNAQSVMRDAAGGGCADTNNNSVDFTAVTAAPRNSASAAVVCAAGGGGGGSGGGGAATAAKIYDIQGSGARSPLAGQVVITEGVVTKLTNNGFFMQDPVGDGNPLTSDGIFVFTTNAAYLATAAVGSVVAVTGTVTEFAVGTGAQAVARPVTELASVSAVVFKNSGYTITPTVVTLPEAVDGDLERYEGMLVTLTGPLTVNQNFFQGRYGQLTLAVGGRLETPTNRFRPGSAQAVALADANARRRILLDDGSSLQNPNPIPYLGANGVPRAGDVAGAITGVIDYGLATNSSDGLSDYRIHPTVAPVFTAANPRTAAPDAVGGNVRVASFNVLNYFTAYTNGGGTADGCALGGGTSRANCRGADNAAEFKRQQDKIVAAMAAIDADVLGLMEIQNNGNVAAQNLVDALNARVGAGTYATTGVPAQVGDDAIRVAMVYKPARLSAVGAAVGDGDAINNRPPLAQAFSLANGQRFTLVVNHLKSKGSCPAVGDADYAGNADTGDGQGCWNARRQAQAQRLRAFVNERLAATGTTDALLIGDFNAYGQEDPIVALTGNGYADQALRFDPAAYSYVFDGAAGRLDHAIANTALAAKVNRVAHWHINADEPAVIDYNTEFKAPEARCGTGGTSACPADPTTGTPYRSSDHDPVVVGLNLHDSVITAAPGSTSVTGTAGDDLILVGAGKRTLTGGAGRDMFVFTAGFAGGATITDFVPGTDTLMLRAVLAGLGITAANPIAQGYLTCTTAGADALINVDPDAAGPAAPRPLILVKGRSCAATLTSANIVF
jgi:predicted extracellular nuclease